MSALGLSCSMWDLIPWPGIKPGPSALRAWTLSHLERQGKVKVKVAQLCPTLCNPMDCIVHGVLQARILEWVAFPLSRGSSQPRDWTQVSRIALLQPPKTHLSFPYSCGPKSVSMTAQGLKGTSCSAVAPRLCSYNWELMCTVVFTRDPPAQFCRLEKQKASPSSC